MPDGRDRVVRHGHRPQRTIQTGVGPVEVRRAKVRDRGEASAAEKIRFSSSILLKWGRRAKSPASARVRPVGRRDLQVVERDLARSALALERVTRLMAIPGIDMVVALALVEATGAVERFDNPQKLVSYLGLNPSARQSGPGPAHHGRITKQGRGHARGMLVKAAWAAARVPRPLRAFFQRVRAKCGQHVAAVATRKPAVLIWRLLSKDESYLSARPALHARKMPISN